MWAGTPWPHARGMTHIPFQMLSDLHHERLADLIGEADRTRRARPAKRLRRIAKGRNHPALAHRSGMIG